MLNFIATTVKAHFSSGALGRMIHALNANVELKVHSWLRMSSPEVVKLQAVISSTVALIGVCAFCANAYEGSWDEHLRKVQVQLHKSCVDTLKLPLALNAQVIVAAPGPLGSWTTKVRACVHVCA